MPSLADLVNECAPILVERWDRAARDRQDGSEQARAEVLEYLAEVPAALGGRAARASPAETTNGAEPKPESVRPDLLLAVPGALPAGTRANLLTRAYGMMHGMILDVAAERRVEVSAEDQRRLAAYTVEAGARAMERQNENDRLRLRKVAHELRNPLGSALMALTLLRSRAELGDGGHLADTLERNLKRIQKLIDDRLAPDSAAAATAPAP